MFTNIVGFTNISAKDENKALELLDKQEGIRRDFGVMHKENYIYI